MIKIGPKIAGAHLLAQVAVGGGNDTCLAEALLGFADPLILAVFEYPQQLGLEFEGQFADLVKEQRAVGRVFKVARLGGDCAGKRAASVAKERRFNQVWRDGSAIQRQKRFLAAASIVVQTGRGDYLLAAARLAFDQHRERQVGILAQLHAQLS